MAKVVEASDRSEVFLPFSEGFSDRFLSFLVLLFEDCGSVNRIKTGDPVRCKSCGCRILYKQRTTRIVQYEAR